VKNHRNGAKNPFAQHQKERTLDEILGGKKISGTFTSLQCTPVGEGAAAVIVASEDGIKRLGIAASRAVRVAASAGRSQKVNIDATRYDAVLTKETAEIAFRLTSWNFTMRSPSRRSSMSKQWVFAARVRRSRGSRTVSSISAAAVRSAPPVD
jgi:acetyl-CoA acetyltransferase